MQQQTEYHYNSNSGLDDSRRLHSGHVDWLTGCENDRSSFILGNHNSNTTQRQRNNNDNGKNTRVNCITTTTMTTAQQRPRRQQQQQQQHTTQQYQKSSFNLKLHEYNVRIYFHLERRGCVTAHQLSKAILT